jgi:hypothetical protein
MPDTSDVAGWRQDPTGDHRYRYHDGTAFTQHVPDPDVVGPSAEDVAYPPTGRPLAAGDFANPRTFELGAAPPRARAQQTLSPPVYGGAWAPLPYTPGPPQWGPVPTHVAPPASKALRVGLWLAVGVAALEAPRRLLEQLRGKRALGNGLSELQHIGNCVEQSVHRYRLDLRPPSPPDSLRGPPQWNFGRGRGHQLLWKAHLKFELRSTG